MKQLSILFLILTGLYSASLAQKPVASWPFDTKSDNIEGSCRLVAGVENSALKLDGFTTLITENGDLLKDITESFSIEGWIALAAYPWNWCPVITQMKEETGGFSFEIGPRGELALKMHLGRNLHTCISDETIPLRAWTHIAAQYELGVGMSLFINGQKVTTYSSTGKPSFAPAEEVRIGMNYEAVFPSNRIGENGITPYWFSLDGILDELKVYNQALPDGALAEHFAAIDHSGLNAPAISARNLPTVPETDAFQAYYTQLKYYPEWDEQWPVGPDADVVVTFQNSPVKLIFWRGTRYSPAWVSENNQWMCDQSVETWNGEEGCKEHMQDRHCLYSHVRIIENTPARKVIHWRYAPVSAYNTFWMANEKTGWNVWIDEYYYVYPDATGIRKVSWKTDYFGYPRQFQETLPLTAAGQTRADIMEVDYLKIANQQGERMQLLYSENPRNEKDLDIIEAPNIQQHNFKAAHDPFIIFEPGNRMHYIMDRAISNLDYPGSCNHWPVGQAYCDGRRTQAADRPAHFLGFPISNPIIHDDPNGRSHWAGLYGMKEAEIEDLIQLSKSWNCAPEMLFESKGLSDGSYHKDEKCYVVETTGERQSIKLVIRAEADRPLVNPSIRLSGFSAKDIKLKLNGKAMKMDQDFSWGMIHRIEGPETVLSLKGTYTKEIRLEIQNN